MIREVQATIGVPTVRLLHAMVNRQFVTFDLGASAPWGRMVIPTFTSWATYAQWRDWCMEGARSFNEDRIKP